MDLLKYFIKYFAHDFYIRRDGLNVKISRRELDLSQFISADELHHLQLARVKKILKFCYGNNRFYRQRFEDCGFVPDDFKSMSDLQKLLILTKEDIREAGENLFSDGYSKENAIHNRTGGSTGVPLHTYMDTDAISLKKAAVLRHDGWAFYRPGDRLAYVWGDTSKQLPLKVRLRQALTDRAFYLDTLKFDEEHIDFFLRQILKYKPPVMMGHAHSIFRLAEYVHDNNIKNIAFKGIITTAMVLSDSERETIETVFRSPVFNRYGCEELSIIASECRSHQGLHIFAEGLYVELDGDDKTIPRRLIITDLTNKAMPMIRYEIGDYAIAAEDDCPCGRGLPRLKSVSGRSADFLYTPDKKPVFGISILDTFVIHIIGFKQLQIVQDKYDHLDFYIVKDDTFSDESLKKLNENIIEIFGDKMNYDIHFVERIEQTERGKFRFSICNIDREKQA